VPGSGTVVVGFDGTPTSEHALRATAPLLAGHRVLIVVVWEAGRAFDLATLPTVDLGTSPGPLDIRTAFEVDRAMYESAQRLAGWGVALARRAGLAAESLVVADDASVADTLVRLVREQDARAVVVGTHGRHRLGELLLGSTARSLVNQAPCPVVVVRV
jgi:nucleotide-binding universal stress UspA family protein